MQEFSEELKDLKQASFVAEKSAPQRVGGKGQADETNNLSRSNYQQQPGDGQKVVGWDDFEPVYPGDVMHSAVLQKMPPSERKEQLPTSLKSNLKVKPGTASVPFQEKPAGPSQMSQSGLPTIYHAFFSNVEKMKMSQSRLSQSAFGSAKNGRSVFSEKDALVIPKDPKSTAQWDRQVEQKIISSLLGPLEVAPAAQLPAKRVQAVYAEPPLHKRSLPRETPVAHQLEQALKTRVQQVPEELQTADLANNSYMELDAYPIYQAPKNLLYLKASSLFNDTILFENEALSLFCRTDKRLLGKTNQVVLVLTYKPKVAGANLIAFLENEEVAKVEPDNLVVRDFEVPVEQSVLFSPSDKQAIRGFPVMNVTMGRPGSEDNIRVVLPFTINKFLRGDPLTMDQVVKYLETVR